MNQQDDVTNCVFGHVTRFSPSSEKDQILSGNLANSDGRNFASVYQTFNLEFLSNNLYTDKKLCSCHMVFNSVKEQAYASVNSSGAHPPPGNHGAFAQMSVPGVGH